jgi:hypothetical protein
MSFKKYCLLKLAVIGFAGWCLSSVYTGFPFEHIKCVFWFYLLLLPAAFLIYKKSLADIIINLPKSSCQVPIILVRL